MQGWDVFCRPRPVELTKPNSRSDLNYSKHAFAHLSVEMPQMSGMLMEEADVLENSFLKISADHTNSSSDQVLQIKAL